MKVVPYDETYRELWDKYVLQNKDSTIFHTSTWKRIVEDVYNLNAKYFMSIADDKITGILPLFLVNHWYSGKKLISLPYSVLGGINADNDEIEKLLISKAIELSRALDVSYLLLRQKKILDYEFKTDGQYFVFVLTLDSDPNKVWKNIHRKSRRCIRIALNENFQIDLDSHDLKEFYHIYSIGQKEFGTPVVSFKWIEKIFKAFPDNHHIAKVSRNGKTVGVMIVREFKNTVYPVIGHALKEYRNLFPLYLLYWKTIEDACKKGFQYYDFGRSIESSGTFKFKQRWGTETIQLNYQYYFNKKGNIPNYSQSSSQRKFMAKFWRKIPLPLTQLVGPHLRKHYL